ncbi:hypothetical protein NT04LM_3993 [Listeria monocytogenes FSL F2-208]|nr:hypothetical protein NT04LM_3993 [Listeria monocytogenes FSL F2-208]
MRENFNPNFTATFHVTSHCDTSCFDLTVCNPRSFNCLKTVFTKCNFSSAFRASTHVSAEFTTVFYTFRN